MVQLEEKGHNQQSKVLRLYITKNCLKKVVRFFGQLFLCPSVTITGRVHPIDKSK